MDVHYLGPSRTFSESAASAVSAALPAARLVPAANLEALAGAVARGSPDGPSRGVLPYYNFLEGLIQESVDLIYEHGLSVVGGTRVPVEFAVGGVPRGPEGTAVYSHPKALAQCSEYLREDVPGAEVHAVPSTAEAARIVRESGSGLAIASPAALEGYGLTVYRRDIGNRRQGRANFTDFLVVGAGPDPGDDRDAAGPSGRTLIAVTPRTERVGLLAEVLNQFAFHGLNIAKIHSRPALDAVPVAIEPQMFYIETICDRRAEALRRCVEALAYRFGAESPRPPVRILGGFGHLGP